MNNKERNSSAGTTTTILVKKNRFLQFASEYILDWNSTRAAKVVGYSEKTAYSQGSRLLKNVEVRTEIERLLADQTGKRNEIRLRVISELERIAYPDNARGEPISVRDRLRALELLGRSVGLFNEKIEKETSHTVTRVIILPDKLNETDWTKKHSDNEDYK